jgi:TolA-binding protein
LAAGSDARVDAEALAEARFLAGLCQAASGQTAAAIDSFSTLLTTTPDFPAADRVLLELGLARSAAGDMAAAEAAFGELRRRFPRSPRQAEAWLETGEMRFAAADWTGAEEAYANVLATAPADAVAAAAVREQAQHKLAWTHVMRQEHEAAARCFGDQLGEHPDGVCAADGGAMLGDALCRLGRYEEAEEVLDRALAATAEISSPDLVGLATVRAAECAAKQERWEESLGLVDRWLGTMPGADGREQARAATVAQGRFARAWAMQNLGRLDDALAEFRVLADDGLRGGEEGGRGPGEMAARARLMEGEILFEQGHHKEAIASFFKVAYGFGETEAPASFHPWQAQATYEAARCFEVLGKTDQAHGLYAELVERYPGAPYVAAARKRIDALGNALK